MYSWQGLPKSQETLYSQHLHGGASQNRTGDTWIFSTMLYTKYQAVTGISDQIKTISVSRIVPVCPVMPIWLLQQHHLPCLDEIACLEAVLKHHSNEDLKPRCFVRGRRFPDVRQS